MVRVYAEDTPLEMAEKIYHGFEVNNSCSILGYVLVGDDTNDFNPVPKGKVVCDELRQLDRIDNYERGNRRKRLILPNTIGGYVAQKIFKYHHEMITMEDGKENVKYTIWRIQ